MLLNRNDPSRLASDSSRGVDATRCARAANSPNDAITTTARNTRRGGPIDDCVKLWTDAMTPERVRNVPRIVNAKVEMIRAMLHACNRPRRAWITAEWMAGVPTSHGRNDAFSTGSQPQ